MVSFQQNVMAKAHPVIQGYLRIKDAVPPIARVKNLDVISGAEEYQEDVSLADCRWQVSIHFL